jgi:hypothetical protein
MFCNCEDFKVNNPLIAEAQIRGGGYSGKFWKFCPWCAFALKENPGDATPVVGNMEVKLKGVGSIKNQLPVSEAQQILSLLKSMGFNPIVHEQSK